MYGAKHTVTVTPNSPLTVKMVSLALRQRNSFRHFVLTFTFSGMMSLADIPEWIHKPALKKGSPTRILHARGPRRKTIPWTTAVS